MSKPIITFAAQAVVPNFPKECHEAIVMTPELQAWALSVRDQYVDRARVARAAERAALALVRGQSSWTAVGGHRLARLADHSAHLLAMVNLLADGRVSGGSLGWVDRREWDQIQAAHDDAQRP